MTFWKKRIYADAAAATPLSKTAHAEFLRLLSLFGNPGAFHQDALKAKEELERARASIAASVGVHADEVIFTGSGTEANNLAVQGVLRPLIRAHKSVHAVTSTIEHQSVLMPLRALTREGLRLTELPVDAEGIVSLEEFAAALRDDTAFVSVQFVNSEVGAIQPVREIAKVIRHARKLRESGPSRERNFSAKKSLDSHTLPAGRQTPMPGRLHQDPYASRMPVLPLFFHIDACQAPLWLSVNIEKLSVDLATFDGQKVLGPKGVGMLFVKRGTAIEPILWGGMQERGLRSGTENVAAVGSFAAALAGAHTGMDARTARVAKIRDFLWSEIKRLIPDAVLNGPHIADDSNRVRADGKTLPVPAERRLRHLAAEPAFAVRVANNLNISIPRLSGELAVVSLDAEGIAVSTRSACSAGDEEPSHVIRALASAAGDSVEAAQRRAREAIRITLLPDATRSDARRIARALAEVVARNRA